MAAEQVVVHKGLEGIYFDTTRICHIDGQRGILLYRGYNIHDLAPTQLTRKSATFSYTTVSQPSKSWLNLTQH